MQIAEGAQTRAEDSPPPDRDRYRRHVHRRRRLRRGHRRDLHHQDAVDARRPVGRRARRDPQDRAAGWSGRVGRGDGGAPAAVAAVSHGTTVATNALLEERFPGLGSRHDAGLPARPGDRAAERAAGLRQLLLLGQARAHRAAPPGARGARAAEFPRRGAARRSTRRRPRRWPRWFRNQRHRLHRRELPPRLRQSRARAAHARRPRARASRARTCRSRPRCCPSTASTSAR